MQVPAGEWLAASTDMVQQICHSCVHCVQVYVLTLNDCDECGIALIKQFNSAAKHKIQKQYPASVGKP